MPSLRVLPLRMQLRRYRIAAGLTQGELATRTGISARTISDLERGLARRLRPDTLALLAEAVQLSPDERAAFEAAARPASLCPLVSPASLQAPTPGEPEEVAAREGRCALPGLATSRNNLPAEVSSFIGRERELSEIGRLLQLYRLVTLTGAGGTGKTRLALRAATAKYDRFADGVWLVELALLASSELVVEAIAKVLARPEISDRSSLDGLSAFLRAKQMLLLLDNCEHIIAECALIAAHLLASCPAVVLLATSREPLGIAGEWVLRVPPLNLPDPSQPVDRAQALHYDGIQLFVERAQAAEPSFRLTDVNAASVVEVCHRLDGIPLALELASVRVRGMGVAYLASRLDDRFRLLAGGDRTATARHETLHALIDWSYDLLSAPERVVSWRLGVFVGGFSLEAAEIVCAGEYTGGSGAAATVAPDAVLGHLLQLVNKSLVQFDQDTGRYRLLETIRLYCLERLAEAGEIQYISRQHFAWYLHLAENGAASLGGLGQKAWFARLEQEHDNLRAALGWALDAGRLDEAARLALSLWRFWQMHTYQREGLRWLEQILALDAATPLPAPLRPQLFNALGVLSHSLHHFERATGYHAEALRLWQERGDRTGMAQALLEIGWQHHEEMKLDQARSYANESLSLATILEDKRAIARALFLGALAATEVSQLDVFPMMFGGVIRPPAAAEAGLLDGVIPALEQSLAIFRELGDIGSVASALDVLASAEEQCGDYERAKLYLAEAVQLHVQLGTYADLIGSFVGLLPIAMSAAQQPEGARRAAQVLGMMTTWNKTIADEPSPWDSELMPDMMAGMTLLLGPDAFAQAFAAGKRMTMADLVRLAAQITAPDPPAVPLVPQRPPPRHAGLTPRELEVLCLVAKGLTNAQVAERLTITPRTVNAHLTAIYSKLGVTARSGAIRYALDHQLG